MTIQPENFRTLGEWARFLGEVEIPVLRKTANDLATLRKLESSPGARSVAQIIRRDPLMTVKLLRHLQKHKNKRQQQEIMQVEQVLIMLGVENTLDQVPAEPLVENLLQHHTAALVHLLQRIHRAHIASNYAFEWAVRLHDTHFEEIRTAALLYDITEMLLRCFVPDKMLEIDTMQQQDKSLRSAAAQKTVLGFTVYDLQDVLVEAWALPGLLIMLMDEAHTAHPRVRNVVLAVNLARHSTHGWNDAALPDDYAAIGELLRITPDDAKILVHAHG
ncbi:HDOD domain-containing protein [Nitrosomonas sp.]|uniref:HDOD domain-containing protein n=1 Tax=Nitrosomonas sp. TaxID=42353 RepID=UPI0025EE7074|nr:HDOD domain-containing protein [Nitrosomonas sp.]MCC6916916.1 HDOD domain-containing protein [Nitrosomonas sp.]